MLFRFWRTQTLSRARENSQQVKINCHHSSASSSLSQEFHCPANTLQQFSHNSANALHLNNVRLNFLKVQPKNNLVPCNLGQLLGSFIQKKTTCEVWAHLQWDQKISCRPDLCSFASSFTLAKCVIWLPSNPLLWLNYLLSNGVM